VVIRAKGREVTTGGVARFSEIGSGVLISPDGKVATAAHVVQLMDNILVEFPGEDPVPARVIDSEPRADISLLQLSVVPRDVTVAPLSDSDRVQVGDPVMIIGAPYGLSHSLSTGVISARWEPNTVTRDFPKAEFFQTDAVINTGNSGGPMFNRTGELVGIVSHNITKSGGSEGLGFVVTANTVKKLLLDRHRTWYGLDTEFVSGAVAEALGLPQPGGLLVKHVVDDSIASRLGLRGGDRLAIVEGQQLVVGGDIVLKIQGIPIVARSEMKNVYQTLDALKPGEEMRATVLRGGRVVELTTKWAGR
jgi:serine protease Do